MAVEEALQVLVIKGDGGEDIRCNCFIVWQKADISKTAINGHVKLDHINSLYFMELRHTLLICVSGRYIYVHRTFKPLAF